MQIRQHRPTDSGERGRHGGVFRAALAGVMLAATAACGSPAGPAPVPAASPSAGYQPAAYRADLEAQLGRPLTDADFAGLEALSRATCAWETRQFESWVAVKSDSGDLNSLYLAVRHVCADRLPDIDATLHKITESQRTCVLPGMDEDSIARQVKERPAQSALTCVAISAPPP